MLITNTIFFLFTHPTTGAGNGIFRGTLSPIMWTQCCGKNPTWNPLFPRHQTDSPGLAISMTEIISPTSRFNSSRAWKWKSVDAKNILHRCCTSQMFQERWKIYIIIQWITDYKNLHFKEKDGVQIRTNYIKTWLLFSIPFTTKTETWIIRFHYIRMSSSGW